MLHGSLGLVQTACRLLPRNADACLTLPKLNSPDTPAEGREFKYSLASGEGQPVARPACYVFATVARIAPARYCITLLISAVGVGVHPRSVGWPFQHFDSPSRGTMPTAAFLCYPRLAFACL